MKTKIFRFHVSWVHGHTIMEVFALSIEEAWDKAQTLVSSLRQDYELELL